MTRSAKNEQVILNLLFSWLIQLIFQDQRILHRILFKLFHIEEAIEANAREIRTQNKALKGLRAEQRVHDQALEAARADQAKSRTSVMQLEKKIKKAEKVLDGKRPDLVTAEAQITHAKRKLTNATKAKAELEAQQEGLQTKVNNLQKELASVKKAADAAQGLSLSFLPSHTQPIV